MKGVLNKKLISIVGGILAFSILCCFVLLGINLPRKDSNNNKNVSAWSGSGTLNEPFKIKTITDLEILAATVAGGESYFDTYFELDADIDYNGEEFCPIGAAMEGTEMTNVNAFCGVFDGGNHVISNLKTTVSSSTVSNVAGFGLPWGVSIGFFAALGVFETSDSYSETNTVATVKNLKIKNYTIKSTQSTCVNMIGGIAGQSRTYADSNNTQNYSVKIEQCVVDGLNVTTTNAASYVSGLVGFQRADGPSDLWTNKTTEYTRALFIKHCMVLNFTNSASNTNSLVATISPALGVTAKSGLATSIEGYSGYYRFYYHIEFCVTDNSDYITVVDILEQPYSGSANNCKTNPDSPTWGNWKRNQTDFEGIYDYDEIYGTIWTSGAYAKNVHSTNAVLSGFQNVSSADQGVWTINSTSGVVYLTQFLDPITYGSNNTDYGTVTCNKTGTTYIPKGDSTSKSGNTIKFFHIFGSYLFTLTATANQGCEFSSWSVTTSKITANFKAENVDINFTKVNFTTLYASTDGGKTFYEILGNYTLQTTVKDQETVKVSYEEFGKSGCYEICYFRFENVDNQDVVVKYVISDNSYFINGNNLTSSNQIKITASTINIDKIAVTTNLKSYGMEVG